MSQHQRPNQGRKLAVRARAALIFLMTVLLTLTVRDSLARKLKGMARLERRHAAPTLKRIVRFGRHHADELIATAYAAMGGCHFVGVHGALIGTIYFVIALLYLIQQGFPV